MRKVSRGSSTGRRSGADKKERGSKPGFRPKGNNRDSYVKRQNRSDRNEDGDNAGSSSARSHRSYGSDRTNNTSRFSSNEERGPRASRERSSGSRFSKEGSERFERGERNSSSEGRFSRRTSSRTPSDGDSPAYKRRGTGDTSRSSFRKPNFNRRQEDDHGDRTETSNSTFKRKNDRGASTGRTPFRKSNSENYEGNREERTERSSSFKRDTDRRSGSRQGGFSADRGERRTRKPFDQSSDDRPVRSRRSNEKDSFKGRGKSTSGGFNRRKSETTGRSRTAKSTLSDSGQTRLNKYIANCGICSRREADDLIKAGVISVNGNIITEMGYQVNPGDEVRYNNEILRGEKLVYLLLNKPKDYITTVDDPSQRHTVMELISGACRERIYPVGRLDRNTTGVLLFTNDGELVRRLLHPSFNVQKVYHVSLSKSLKPDEFQKISDGVYLDDGLVKVDDIAYAGDGTDRKEIGIELHSGRNRVVRRIFEHFGHEVVKLDRTVFAGLTKKDLPRGRYRMLTSMEIANLKMMVGDKRYREAMLNEE